MKLSEWARKNGLTYKTAHRLFQNGKLPVKSQQLSTGTILVEESSIQTSLKTYIYCRVSSYAKKDDLKRQADRCVAFCEASGWQVEKIIQEIASGMNDNRRKLFQLFSSDPKRIVVEHKDRLTRFGFGYFEKLLPLLKYEIVVINRDTEDEQDLMKDLVAIITSFCCRLYGLRRGQNKVKRVKEIISNKEQ